MTTSYARQQAKIGRIRAHGNRLLAIFPNATEKDPVALCKKLRRLEAKATAIALRLCNGPEYSSEEEPDRLCDAILVKVRDLLQDYETPWFKFVPIFINRDPRGYALKIDEEWMRVHPNCIYRDMGGYGIIAPDLND